MTDNFEIAIEWDAASRAQWNRLIKSSGQSALEQSWAYGEAATAHHRQRVRRALVSVDDKPAALLQATDSRLVPGLRLVRVTRGPVWLDAPRDGAARNAVIRAIRAEFGLARRTVLLWLPELPDTPESAAAMRMAGTRRMVTGYGSIWLDLQPDEAKLRAGLDGKWRNALNGAERAKLKVDRASTGSALAGLLVAYDAMRRGKRFSGPSGAFVSHLAEIARRDGDLFVLRAVVGGEMVAGALFVRHGSSATYVVGWTGEAGRAEGAGQLVLWRGVQALKAAKIRWLDLGGISAGEPGIARFKLGLGGQPFTLSGTWL